MVVVAALSSLKPSRVSRNFFYLMIGRTPNSGFFFRFLSPVQMCKFYVSKTEFPLKLSLRRRSIAFFYAGVVLCDLILPEPTTLVDYRLGVGLLTADPSSKNVETFFLLFISIDCSNYFFFEKRTISLFGTTHTGLEGRPRVGLSIIDF